MKIGIIVAMGKELRLLLPLLAEAHVQERGGYTFHIGSVGPHEVIAMQCGIGKVNAALGTLTLLREFSPALVVNTGVAGGTGGGAGIMDVVVGEKIAYHDVWCGPGTEWGVAAGCPRFFLSAPEITAMDIFDGDPSVHRGLIASGDIFVSRPEEVAAFRKLYPEVMAVDMESAAIAQTCHLNGVPFLVIRVISDTPGGSDNIAQYENFWEQAPEHTFHLLHKLLKQLPA